MKGKALTPRQEAMILAPSSQGAQAKLEVALEAAGTAATEKEIAARAGWTVRELRWLLDQAARADAHPILSDFLSGYLRARGAVMSQLREKVWYDAMDPDSSPNQAVELARVVERDSWNDVPAQAPAQAQQTTIHIDRSLWEDGEVIDAT